MRALAGLAALAPADQPSRSSVIECPSVGLSFAFGRASKFGRAAQGPCVPQICEVALARHLREQGRYELEGG